MSTNPKKSKDPPGFKNQSRSLNPAQSGAVAEESPNSEKTEDLPTFKDQARSRNPVRPGAVAESGNHKKTEDLPDFKDQARSRNPARPRANRDPLDPRDSGNAGLPSFKDQADDRALRSSRPEAIHAASNHQKSDVVAAPPLPTFKDQAQDRQRGNVHRSIRSGIAQSSFGPGYKDQVRAAPKGGAPNLNAQRSQAMPSGSDASRVAEDDLEDGRISTPREHTRNRSTSSNNDAGNLVNAELVESGVTIAQATPVNIIRRRVFLLALGLLVVVAAISGPVVVTQRDGTGGPTISNSGPTIDNTIGNRVPTASPTGQLIEPVREWVKFGADERLSRYSEDAAGTSIAISRNGLSIVVGAPGAQFQGAYVYRFEDRRPKWNKWVLYTYFSGKDDDDAFGRSVAVDDSATIVACGAPSMPWDPLFPEAQVGYQVIEPQSNGTGVVTVYQVVKSVSDDDEGAFVQLGSTINGTESGGEFGFSLSMSGNGQIIAAGARTGCLVRVLEYNDEVQDWIDLGQRLDCSAGEYHSSFGYSVALSDDGRILAVGEVLEGGEFQFGNGDPSRVHVFRFDESLNEWKTLGEPLIGKDGTFGSSLALSDDGLVLAVGAPSELVRMESERGDFGVCRVYGFSENSWNQLGSDINDADKVDYLGYAVSLNAEGNVVAIGAPAGNSEIGQDSGVIRVYEYDSSNDAWHQIGENIPGPFVEAFGGSSVALSARGDIVTFGSPNTGDGAEHFDNVGGANVYETGVVSETGEFPITLVMQTDLRELNWFVERLDIERQSSLMLSSGFARAFTECKDTIGWTDVTGRNCSSLSCYNAEENTNNEGLSALDACCDCDGGTVTPLPPTVEVCENFEGWRCYSYEENPNDCEGAESDTDNDGVSALEACCVCGGGIRGSYGQTENTTIMVSEGGVYRIRLWINPKDQRPGADGAEYSLYLSNDASDENLRVVRGSGNFQVDTQHTFLAAPSSSMASRPSGERFITLVLDFEERPFDVSWVLVASEVIGASSAGSRVRSGRTVLAFGPSQRYDESDGSVYQETIDVSLMSSRSTMRLIFLDDGIDGFCCENGSASYRVYNGTSMSDDDILVSSGSERRRREVTRFSIYTTP